MSELKSVEDLNRELKAEREKKRPIGSRAECPSEKGPGPFPAHVGSAGGGEAAHRPGVARRNRPGFDRGKDQPPGGVADPGGVFASGAIGGEHRHRGPGLAAGAPSLFGSAPFPVGRFGVGIGLEVVCGAARKAERYSHNFFSPLYLPGACLPRSRPPVSGWSRNL